MTFGGSNLLRIWYEPTGDRRWQTDANPGVNLLHDGDGKSVEPRKGRASVWRRRRQRNHLTARLRRHDG